jgi:heme/copper-type cytochrome/quinol oxidase subunit 3
MSLTTALNAPPRPQSRRGLLTLLSVVGLLGLAFIAVAALPYYRLDPDQFATYWPRRWWLLAHITTGIVALMTGPVQLWLGLTDRRPELHRRLGTIYLGAVVTSAIAAYYLAIHTDVTVLFGAGLAGLATAWLITSGMAYLAIRRHLTEQHKEWMIRSYVVTTAFVTFRAIVVVLEATKMGGEPFDRLGIASWVCWAGPLLLAEAWLQGRKILAVRPE